jgi:enoyl-[acyl-carrier protein] reductase/trans-2-enoyl-CoA reductase (NAD+)
MIRLLLWVVKIGKCGLMLFKKAGVLAEGAKTTAFTYIGEKITWDLYWDGTIGQAKKDLDTKVLNIRDQLASSGGDARVSVLKAVVTQASSAIPIMPLYLSYAVQRDEEDRYP